MLRCKQSSDDSRENTQFYTRQKGLAELPAERRRNGRKLEQQKMTRLTERERNQIQKSKAAPTMVEREQEAHDLEWMIVDSRKRQGETTRRQIAGVCHSLLDVLRLGYKLVARVVAPIRQEMIRRKAVRELAQLDDYLLADIGIERGSITEIADQLAALEQGRREASESTQTEARPRSEATRLASAVKSFSEGLNGPGAHTAA